MASFADKLLAASEDETLSPAELRALLRQAALRLKKLAPASPAESLDLINRAKAAASRSPHRKGR